MSPDSRLCYTRLMDDVRYGPFSSEDQASFVALYRSVGWSTYADDPVRLMQAIGASDWVLCAWQGDQLVGLARALTDGVSVTYLQDVLVHPDHQRRGIGRVLLTRWLGDHEDVRQRVLLTDDRPEQKALYRSMGLHRVGPGSESPLNAYVQIVGADLPV